MMSYGNKSKERVLIVFSGRIDNRMKLTKSVSAIVGLEHALSLFYPDL
jgi:hypothetical protein